MTNNLRIDSNFSVGSLRLNKIEPTLYVCGELPEPSYNCSYNGSVFKISVNGRERYLDVSSENLRKIRHEIVCSVMLFESDMPLKTIGVKGEEGDLTPDYINTTYKSVLEVGTSAISELYSLKKLYTGKVIKYSYLIEPTDYDLFVLIVSPSRVYCNFEMTQDLVNCLCLRARIGLALESVISEYLGQDMFSEDHTADEAIVKDVFRGLTMNTKSSSDFDLDKISSINDPMTIDDKKHVGKILKATLAESTMSSSNSSEELKRYLDGFEGFSKTSDKRITNIPMIYQNKIPLDDIETDEENCRDMPLYLKKIWGASSSAKPRDLSKEEQLEEAMGLKYYERHRIQKGAAFNVKNLTEADKIEAAKSGLWAKALSENPDLMAKSADDKKSFHPTLTETSDILEFHNKILLKSEVNTIVPKEIFKLICKGKQIWGGKKSLSVNIFNKLQHTVLANFGQTISNIMTEICYSHKYWIKRSDFYHKIHKGIHILIRCTGDHIFAIFAFPKSSCKLLEVGRIGPRIWESNNFYFTDVCSFNEPSIEHFVKSGPYMISIASHMLSHLELDLSNIDFMNVVLNQHIAGILLLFLNNKTDCEELITSQRYLTMGVLEELDPNPYRFCERLPEVIRSRLTCYFLKKTIRHMQYYSETKVLKIPNKETLEYDIVYSGLKSMFADYEPSLKQKINEFYFGYVVSKERGRGSDRNFKIMKKIVAEEYRFRDTVLSTFNESLNTQIHVSNRIMIKVFVNIFKSILKEILGKDYELIIKKEIIRSLAQCSFEDLATLKVSSRSYNDSIVVPNLDDSMTNKMMKDLYEKSNPQEKVKRPRVMESISLLVEEFEEAENRKIKHPVELIPYCLKEIEKRGFWDSDIFPKSQHGGDREIHVLEVKMRVLQYFVESMSKTLCRLIPSDTLTHPYEKETFVKKHYQESAQKLGKQFFTMGKSADATKWCQRNDSSKFAAVISPFLPDEFKPFFVHVMSLWKCKRISFPIQFAANFQANRKTKSNHIYTRMKTEFFNGDGIFSQAQSNKMFIRSGMMQGILHYTSSFTHTMIQEVMKKLQTDYLKRRGILCNITVVQGSDDSGQLLSLMGTPSHNRTRLATTLLHWKENVSKYFSIYTSRAKSSIGCLDLIEFNSEWMVRSNVVKPTFRWVSACLETSVTERFIDRIRMNYNVSSQVLEGGGKVLEVALIQLCQAWMHYLLIGLHTSKLSLKAASDILDQLDPALGFYPLDSDFCAGITGVEFQIYRLFMSTDYGRGLTYANIHEPDIKYEEEEIPDQSVSKSLRSVKISFSNMKLWHDQVRRMGIPELEQLVSEVEENPYLIYARHKAWSEAKFAVFLKMFQPGVKESISKHAATARVMSASAYLISRPCVSIYVSGDLMKVSLLRALAYNKLETEGKVKLDPSLTFTHSEEYREVMDYIIDLESKSTMVPSKLRTRNKQKISVFERAIDDIPLIDLCRKRWFGIGRLPLSKRQFETFWQDVKLKYPFIKDDRQETKLILKCNEVELKGFLESITSKPRHIVLLDTSAKSSSLFNSISRIFWTGVKLVLPGKSDEEETSYSIRSKLFTILTSWYSDTIKKKRIQEIIMDSPTLGKIRVPQRIKKLRVLRKWLTNQDKSSIVKYISDEKLGTVGFFTSRQRGWGKTRSGLGEWRGKCLDVSVIISMSGNCCSQITLSKLTDLRTLGPLLLDLMNSFSLESPDINNDNYDHWLTGSGRIVGGFGKATYYPIKVDNTLKIDIIDQISDYTWSWSVGNNRIRLQAEYGVNQKITILSEGFSCKDWDPDFTIDDDKLLKHWSSGTPIPIEVIDEEILSVCKPLPGDIMKANRNRRTALTKSGWNLGELLDSIKKQLLSTEDVLEMVADDEVDEDMNEDIEALLNEMNMDIDEAIDWTMDDKFDELESDIDDDDLFETNIDLFDQIENQLALFTINPLLDEFTLNDRNSMPKTNLALSNIDTLSRVLLGDADFMSTVKKFKTDHSLVAPGFMGLLLSFYCGRVCIPVPNTESELITYLEQDSARISSIASDATGLDSLDINDLESRINYLRDEIEKAPVGLQQTLMNILNRYENAMTMSKLSKTKESDMDTYKVVDVCHKVKDRLLNLELVPSSYRMLSTHVFHQILKAELDTHIDDLTKDGKLTFAQQSVYRESTCKSYLTTLFLDILSSRFNLRISCCGYETSGEHEITL
uniref:RNA-directed RNA polymerase L n=1 Tax=Citrus concave gum-associated virus TaxID=2024604 RepID=A0A514Y8U1_9VIRU|nr:RNA-dependent RNA polymerase [Citrus concave gum-associated virus]